MLGEVPAEVCLLRPCPEDVRTRAPRTEADGAHAECSQQAGSLLRLSRRFFENIDHVLLRFILNKVGSAVQYRGAWFGCGRAHARDKG